MIPLAPLAILAGQTPVERVLLLGSLLLVLSAELLNSAIEQVVDKISPEFAVFAGRAKDMGSAAVFVTMLNVIAVWGCLLAPRWI
jgi:diacylglycerol kinase (ATP)